MIKYRKDMVALIETNGRTNKYDGITTIVYVYLNTSNGLCIGQYYLAIFNDISQI